MRNLLFTTLFFVTATLFCIGQANSEQDFEVDRIDPPLSLKKAEMTSANTIQDLNKHFKPEWVKEYLEVEVVALHQGATKRVLGKAHTLNDAQKDLMLNADVGSRISVVVSYMPENTLKHNEAKAFDFSFLINPDFSAKYPTGREDLKAYLKEVAVDRIPDGVITGYDLAAIKFAVDVDGNIVDAEVFAPSKSEAVDKLLLDAVLNMPKWIPAEYSNGLRVRQEFAFSVGNRESCVVNLLNVAEE